MNLLLLTPLVMGLSAQLTIGQANPIEPVENPVERPAANPGQDETTLDTGVTTIDAVPSATNWGHLAPNSAYAWLRVNKVRQLARALETHAIAQAWTSLRGKDSAIQGQIADLLRGIDRYTRSHGFSTEMVAATLEGDLRISLFKTRGQNDFLALADLEEHADTLSVAFETFRVETPKWLADRPQIPLYRLALPFGIPGHIFASINESRILIGGTESAIRTGLGLVAGKGKSLADDPAFAGCTEANPDAWLMSFVRPLDLMKGLDTSKGGRDLSTFVKAGVPELRGVFYASTHVNGRFEDKIQIVLPDNSVHPLDFLGDGRLSKRLATLLPKGTARWMACKISPERMLSFAARCEWSLPMIGSIASLQKRLEKEEIPATTKDIANLLGDELLWLPSILTDGPTSLVVTLNDSFRVKQILGLLAKEEPTTEDSPEATTFTWIDGKRELHLAIRGDHLFASTERSGLDHLLSDTSEPDPEIIALFGAQAESSSFVAFETPSYWVECFDPQGQMGLLPIVTSLDKLVIHGAVKDGKCVARIESATGQTASLALALVEVGPELLRYRIQGNEVRALEFAKVIRDAEIAWFKLVADDETRQDKRGTLVDLVGQEWLTGSATDVTSQGVLTKDAYGFRLLFDAPESKGDTPDFVVLAWPLRPGSSGKTSFLITGEGKIHNNPWLTGLDPNVGPMPDQVFAGSLFASEFRAGWSQPNKNTAVAKTETATTTELTNRGITALPAEKAIQLLDKAFEKKDTKVIRSYLAHDANEVRIRSAYFLGELRDKESVPDIAFLLEARSDQELRRHAARALSRMKDARADATLIQTLADKDGKVRMFAATGLLSSKSPGVAEAMLQLIDAFDDDEHGDRTQAVLALSDKLDTSCLQTLALAKKGGDRFQQALVYCFQTLSPKLAHEPEGELLIVTLGSPNARLRRYAIERLAEGGHGESIPALTEHLAKEDGELKVLTQRALTKLRPAEGTDFGEIWTTLQSKTKSAYAQLRRQPTHIQAIAAGVPLLAFIMLIFYFRARRGRKRRKSKVEVLEFLKPSDEFLKENNADPDDFAPPIPHIADDSFLEGDQLMSMGNAEDETRP